MGQAPGNQRQHGQVSLHMGSYRHTSLEIQFDREDLMRKREWKQRHYSPGVQTEVNLLTEKKLFVILLVHSVSKSLVDDGSTDLPSSPHMIAL